MHLCNPLLKGATFILPCLILGYKFVLFFFASGESTVATFLAHIFLKRRRLTAEKHSHAPDSHLFRATFVHSV